jgi:hypothetical protein
MRYLSTLIAGALLSASSAAWDCGCAYGQMLVVPPAKDAHMACHAGQEAAPAPVGQDEDCCPGCRVEISDLSFSHLQLAAPNNGHFGFSPLSLGIDNPSQIIGVGFLRSTGSWGLPRSDILIRKVPLYLSERSLLC